MSAPGPDRKRVRGRPKTAAKDGAKASPAKRKPTRRPAGRRPTEGGAHQLAERAAKLVRTRVLAPARRLVARFVHLWLALAERAGALVLRAWRRGLRPALAALAALARGAYRALDRHLTPARAVGVACAVALAVLIASQWVDYRMVTVGTDAYAGPAGAVATAPELERARTGDAHAWLVLPLALAGAVALALAFAGRPRAARGLIAVGVATLVLSLAVDAPKGLDLGGAGVAYEGATASLIEGFWLQVATAAVLIAGGLLLLRHLHPRAGAAERTPRARARKAKSARGRKAGGARPRPAGGTGG